MTRALTLLALVLGVLLGSSTHAAERRVALVIGNAAYPDAPLRTPVNDARLMAATLRQLGFAVTELENAAQKPMSRALVAFIEALNGAEVGLLYYAGHGLQIKGRNYLVPIDAELASETAARVDSIELDALLDALPSAAGRLDLVILDASRSHPLERRPVGAPRGLAAVQAPPGSLVAFATRPGKVVADDQGETSLYTTSLAQAMTEPGLPIEGVFKRVRVALARATDDRQLPWEASSLTADFAFAPSADDAELADWLAVRDSPGEASLRGFLARHPHGWFAPLARSRLSTMVIGALDASPAARPVAGVDGNWNIKLYGCGVALNYMLTDVSVSDGRLVGRSRDPASRAAWDLTMVQVRPDEIALTGRVSSYIGYTGIWEAAGKLVDQTYKGYGRHPFWHGIGCFFEATRR
jgi:hypothetical protein